MFSVYHLHLYARPLRVSLGRPLQLATANLATLASDDLDMCQFEVSFEDAVEALGQLERMFIELDGSFVWTGEINSQRWQLDGMLYDRAEHLQRVELRGNCPAAAWRQLVSALGWPTQPLLAHWLEHHCLVDVDDWLAWLPDSIL